MVEGASQPREVGQPRDQDEDRCRRGVGRSQNAVRAGTFDKLGLDPPREVSPQTFREFAQVYKERHVLAKRLALARSIDTA